MEIRKVYKTSKGIFENKEKAEKNRAKVNCCDGRGGWWKEKEDIVEIWAIFDSHNEQVFALTSIDVKF
jgi:hypothetical protein